MYQCMVWRLPCSHWSFTLTQGEFCLLSSFLTYWHAYFHTLCSSYLQDWPYHIDWRVSGISLHSFTTGVPQRSVFAPLLFSHYTKLQNLEIRFHGFSYDTQLPPPMLPGIYWSPSRHLFLDENSSILRKNQLMYLLMKNFPLLDLSMTIDTVAFNPSTYSQES